MKALPLILAVVLTQITRGDEPSPHLGRVLPLVVLYSNATLRQVRIIAHDPEGITVVDPAGKETRISRYSLKPDARVALGFPEDPEIRPIHQHFRIVQVIAGLGYIAREETPFEALGSNAQATAERFGRGGQAEVSETLYLLRGTITGPIADGDIVYVEYIFTDQVHTYTTVLGAPATLHIRQIIGGEKYRRIP